MSFVGGGAECSTNGNVISQFNKHTQQDRSLQRQTAAQPGVSANGTFKNDNMMSTQEKQNLEQFMGGGPGQQSFQFQPMRHELNVIQHNRPQTVVPNQWSEEFQSHGPMMAEHRFSPGVVESSSRGNAQWATEFRPQVEHAMNYSPGQKYSSMSSMHMGHRPMSGNSMMAGRMGSPMTQSHAQQPKTDEPQVDWDNQFKEIEQLENEASVEKEETKEGSPEIVIDDKYQATFQEVWDNLNSDAMENDFINHQYEEFKSTQKDLEGANLEQWEKDFAKYASTRAHFGEYKFEENNNNQFLDLPADQDPYELGLQLMENGAKLSEAALAFEAAIQKNDSHIDAWLKLGEVQTQNEKEIAGIAALEKCLELHPENSSALMSLAISYVNEGYHNAAFATLERWLATKYPDIAAQAKKEDPGIASEVRYTLIDRVINLFMKAAQLSPDQASMDADVQMGLGVLFYADEDFVKTIDCFRAALTIRPDDAVLWNRLGASLANFNHPEEAVDAYFKALELKPTFVRARYNLGVCCINIGCYKEAAEHLLSGLAMHQVEGQQNTTVSKLSHNQSTSLMETLKRAFIAMERRDLLDLVKPNMDVNQFRSEFNF